MKTFDSGELATLVCGSLWREPSEMSAGRNSRTVTPLTINKGVECLVDLTIHVWYIYQLYNHYRKFETKYFVINKKGALGKYIKVVKELNIIYIIYYEYQDMLQEQE